MAFSAFTLSANGIKSGIAPKALSFGESLLTVFTAQAESAVHPHVASERAQLYRSFSGEAAELETLTFLNALVGIFKPVHVLETGTGCGYATVALAAALASNGFGSLDSVDTDPGALDRAKCITGSVGQKLTEHVAWHCRPSLDFIADYGGSPFDFCFFDSLIALRHKEFEALLERNLLTQGALCVWHDASRSRKETADDNSEMIAALDRHSTGRQWLEVPFSRGLRLIRLGGEE